MALGKFFGLFAKTKVESVGMSLAQKLAQFDPATATAAGMLELESNLDDMLKETATARQEYQKEQQEATVARNNLNQLKAAARRLGDELTAAAPESDRYRQVEQSLTDCLNRIDAATPEVEREESEAALAKQTLDMLEQASSECATQLRTAKSDFENSARQLKSAQAAEKLATSAAEKAAKVAGIRNSGSQMSVAVTAMQKATAESQARADAALQKAKLLENPTAPTNDLLDSILAEGQPTKSTNPLDRLKNLD